MPVLACGRYSDGFIAPDERTGVEAAARREFPFGLSRQPLARPAGVRHGVVPRDLNDRMVLAAVVGATRSLRMLPVRARRPLPPLGEIIEVNPACRRREHQRPGNQVLGAAAKCRAAPGS